LNSIDPWDGSRVDMQTGIIAALIASAASGKSVKADKYIPNYEGPTLDKIASDERDKVEEYMMANTENNWDNIKRMFGFM